MAQMIPDIDTGSKYPDWGAPFMPGWNGGSVGDQFRIFHANEYRYDFLGNELPGYHSASGDPDVSGPAQSNQPALSNSDFVAGLYQKYYHRAADAPGLAFWVNELTTQRKDRAGVEAAFASSPDIIQSAAATSSPTTTTSTVPTAPASFFRQYGLIIVIGLAIWAASKD